MPGDRSTILFVIFSVASITFAATVPKKGCLPALCDPSTGIGCLPSPSDCPEGCLCNRADVDAEVFTSTEKRPSERMEFAFIRTVTNYGSGGVSDENDLDGGDRFATMLHEKVERVFRGIIVSAVLFIVCAGVCVVSVCLYCAHIRHSDRKLKKEVKAMAKKLKVNVNKNPTPSTSARDPISESCNVVVQDANVMCV